MKSKIHNFPLKLSFILELFPFWTGIWLYHGRVFNPHKCNPWNFYTSTSANTSDDFKKWICIVLALITWKGMNRKPSFLLRLLVWQSKVLAFSRLNKYIKWVFSISFNWPQSYRNSSNQFRSKPVRKCHSRRSLKIWDLPSQTVPSFRCAKVSIFSNTIGKLFRQIDSVLSLNVDRKLERRLSFGPHTRSASTTNTKSIKKQIQSTFRTI